MKVCLIRPPNVVSPIAYTALLVPPLGLAYVAAFLKEAGHDVVVIDGIGEAPLRAAPHRERWLLQGLSFDEILERIPRDAGLIGVSGMFSSDWVHVRSLINLIGGRFPGVPFIAGGEHFTGAPALSLQQCPCLTACVLGEGEETALEVVQSLERRESLAEVAGLALNQGGEMVRTRPRARLRALDSLPLPAWDLIPVANYLDNLLSYGVNRGRSMPMLASRGCPYQCTFCSNPEMWGTQWLARDPKRVADEIQMYIEKYGITNVDFCDLTAIVRRDWIMAFCRELIERDIRITWQLPSGTRSEAIDREVSRWLYRSGCRNLNYAPESGSKDTLRRIKKGISLSKMRDSLKGALKAGINVKINIIIGFPQENHREIWKTFWFLVKLSWMGAHDAAIGMFAPYPGSELYEELLREGKIDLSDDYFNHLAYVDVSRARSFSRHLSDSWLRFYNLLGFAIFYLTNYLFRPWRLWRTLRNLVKNQHESRGEMVLSALLKRIKWAGGGKPAAGGPARY